MKFILKQPKFYLKHIFVCITFIISHFVAVTSASADFTFAIAGDHGSGSNFDSVFNKIGSFGGSINFFLTLGDLSYGGQSESSWAQDVKNNLNLGAGLPLGDPFGENYAYQIVSGNHDDDYSGGLIDRFATYLPDRLNSVLSPHYTGPIDTTNYGKEYYFDYPSGSPLTRFIMISPNLTFTNGGSYEYTVGSNRYNWVRDTIDAARNAGISWVVVGMHKNCLATGTKSCSIGSDLMNLLNSQDATGRQRVDLILQGHDHNYQRGKQLALRTGCTAIATGSTDLDCIVDDGLDNLYTKGAGTVLVIDGTGGQSLYTISTGDGENGYFAAWMGSTSGSNSQPPGGNGTWGITKFTVSDTYLTSQFVSAAGANYTDNFTIASGPLPTPSPGTPTPTPQPTPSPGAASPTPSPQPSGTTPTPSSIPGPILTFSPIDDATIIQGSPDTNYGTNTNVQVDNGPVEQFLIKFAVSGVNGHTVSSAKLRLYNTNSSNSGGELKKVVDNSWNEETVTWNTASPAEPTSLVTLGSVTSNTWYDIDLTSLITSDGTYTIRASSTSSDGADYSSKEGSHIPELVVILTSDLASPSPASLLGDANGDQIVDEVDYSIWLTHYSQITTNGASDGDFNLDGKVSVIDFAIWRMNYTATSTPTPSSTSLPTTTPPPGGLLKAFPGAEGFGADSLGGRGGKVMEVTNLNDSGTGSLRACIEASGPRTCVFRVAGTINLLDGLKVKNPYLTIAGQTAPGGGITLKNDLSNGDEVIRIGDQSINAHNIVIRYLRSRPGASTANSCCNSAFRILGGSNIVLDHVSGSWANDDNFTNWSDVTYLYQPSKITVQWSISSESLNYSTHNETGPHGHGFHIGNHVSEITLHHTLLAHNYNRNPDMSGDTSVEVINNLVYNWEKSSNGGTNMRDNEGQGASFINVIGNHYLPGVDTPTKLKGITITSTANASSRLYADANIGPCRPTDTDDDWLPVYDLTNGLPDSLDCTRDLNSPFRTDSFAFTPSGVTTQPAGQVKDLVLGNAGATIGLNADGTSFLRRDAVDKRVIEEVTRGEGKIIDCPAQNSPSYDSPTDCSTRIYLTPGDYTKYGITDPLDGNGWPILDSGTPYADSDHDGMADIWEINNFSSTSRGSATDSSSDFDGDGYTDLEEFLNGTDPKI